MNDQVRDGDELVRLEGLEVHFPIRGGFVDLVRRRPVGVVRAVDGIDLTIRKGEVLGLVGESGSGKTTTGRVIVKLTRPTGGRLLLEGEDVTDVWGGDRLRRYRRRVQFIFQDPYETLNPKQTIHDFVAEPLEVQGIGASAAECERLVLEAIDTAGLRPATDFAFRYPHELSGGQRQRVVIAGALVLDPKIVVADEPVSMLDVSIRTEILNLMLDLRHQRDLTYLFITHDLSVAWVVADRIAVMYLGKVMELGTAEEVINDPRHPYTRALVSVMPTPEPPQPGHRARRIILVGETPDAAHIPTGCRFHPRCPLAEQAGILERCRTQEPPLIDLGNGRVSACWLAESGKPLPAVERRADGATGDAAPPVAAPPVAAPPVAAPPGAAARPDGVAGP